MALKLWVVEKLLIFKQAIIKMAEEVSTGGLKSFRYGKGKDLKMSNEQKKEIDEAYGKYYERREKEKRNRTIFWVVAGLIVLLVLGFIIWKFFL